MKGRLVHSIPSYYGRRTPKTLRTHKRDIRYTFFVRVSHVAFHCCRLETTVEKRERMNDPTEKIPLSLPIRTSGVCACVHMRVNS